MIVTVTPNPGLDRTLTVPELRLDEVMRALDVQIDPGGKGFNVARALGALGVKALALGFCGGDAGRTLARRLAEAGIEAELTPVAGETRTNTVVIDARAAHHYKVNEPGPEISRDELEAFFQGVRRRVQPGDLWALCGSLPPGVPTDFYAMLIRILRQAGARVFLDASGEAMRCGCAERPDLVKPNADEAEELTGQPVRTVEEARLAAEALLGRGAGMVALSLGSGGLLLATRDHGSAWAKPPHCSVANAVGAGDALLAGLIWRLARGRGDQAMDVADVARWAVAAGTAAACRPGVTFGDLAEVSALYPLVTVV